VAARSSRRDVPTPGAARRSNVDVAGVTGAAEGAGAPRALALALAATLALRALGALLPGRWLWGVDLGRDLPPAAFWLPWAVTAALLAPALARPLERMFPATARATLLTGLALAALAAALAWSFPDRLRFTGDSGMRHGAFATTDHPLLLVPQAMPGDLALHWALPRWLAARGGPDSETTDRLIGVLLAALNGVAALALARVRHLRGPAALAAMAIAGWTASLALFDGYAKSLVDLAVVELAAAAALFSLARGGRGAAALGAATAFAIALHRLGLVLVPAWLAGLALAARGAWGANARGRARADWLAGAALPLASLAWLAPRLVHTLGGFDVPHHLLSGGATPGAAAAQLVSAEHLRDVANVLLLLSPALPLAFGLGRGGDSPRTRERIAGLALVLPPLLLLLVLRPQQGLFRDWDVFAVAGVALSAWLAVAVGERLAARPAAALAIPVALLAMVPATQWLAHQSDLERGLARTRAILEGPPARTAEERATGFDRLGLLFFDRQDPVHMAEACSLSVAAEPNPRVIVEWAMAQTLEQRYSDAQRNYLRAAALNPTFTLAWRGVAASSGALGDVPNMERAARQLLRLDPHGPTTHDALAWLEAHGIAVDGPRR